MEKRYEIRKKERMRKRLAKKKRKKFVTYLGVVTCMLAFIFVLTSIRNKDGQKAATIKAVAKSGSEDIENKGKDNSVDSQRSKDNDNEKATVDGANKAVSAKDEKLTVEGYKDRVHEFLRVEEKAILHSRPRSSSERLAELSEVSLETYGMENGWVKVKYLSQTGYIEAGKLKKIDSDKLYKLVDGILVINKDYGVDESFISSFSSEAEAALKSMLEALERKKLKVVVGTKYRSYDDEKAYLEDVTNSKKYKPNPGHSEFQSGTTVELYNQGAEQRLDNKLSQTDAGKWLYENCYKYGFILRYPKDKASITGYAEDGIFKYVGIETAKEIQKSKKSLEEFLKLK